ncbi:unnamed protein product [Rotaria sp. Silwood2]|nr:unnamed protein product [Rotaria sp. Silwood2]
MNVNAHNVIKILSNLVSTNLPISRSSRIGSPRDEEVAKQLFDNLISIINSTHFYVENETSLDHTCDFDDDDSEETDTDPTIADHLIGIITEQIVYKNQHLALLRRECSLSNEYCVTTGLYSVVGACAFLDGVSLIIVSLVVLMSKVIDSLSYIVPLRVYIALIAKWVGDAFSERIYEEIIKLNGYSYLGNEKLKEEIKFYFSI